MAQEKEERPKEERPGATTRKPNEPGAQGRATPREAEMAGSRELEAAPPESRRERYLIGIRTTPDGQPLGYPLAMEEVVRYLTREESVEVVRRVKLGAEKPGAEQPFVADGRSASEFVVAKIDERKAQWLRSVAPPQLIIERDASLACADYPWVPAYPWAAARPVSIGTLLPLRSVPGEVTLRVVGERDQPLARATVVIGGAGLPVQALTDESGIARITFFGGSIEAIQTLFVRAASNHWDRLICAPRLSSGANTVRLRPLSELYPNFPNERLRTWGQRLMGLDPAAGQFTGSGVRIGVIDSGCDNTHPLLRHVTRGKDFTSTAPAGASWTQDVLSHGTHCAGILSASSTEQGIVGCAPESELHVFKVLPGGRLSDLLAALDECIARELDLINISVVADGFSELIAQKLAEARRRGIACVVAAGNSGGPVVFPAALPGVLAVAAVGKLREFPDDSPHAQSIGPQLTGAEGLFAASFSGAGPQVALRAPGVALVSTVPGGGYAAADGTSIAAAHVTGFAALILAHHPLFQAAAYKARSAERVHALFELIRASAVPRLSADPQHSGAGVPELSRVPGGRDLALGLAFGDGAQRFAMAPMYWPQSGATWPAWPTPMGASAAVF
jgi:subtilisin